MANQSLRLKARGAGVPLWKIAKELNISEPTLTRMLREPLKQEESLRILAVIEKLRITTDR